MQKPIQKNNCGLKNGIDIRLYWTDAIWASGICLMFIASLELFYRMIVKYNGKYPSDMRAFTHGAVTDGEIHTRFIESLFQVFYNLNHATIEMNIYLAAVIAAILVSNFIVLRFFLKRDGIYDSMPRWVVQAMSFIAFFTGPIYFPILHEWFYLHSFASFAWQSPTYQTMVLFSLLAMLSFLAMYLDYEEGISILWWIATCITALLSASAKPSHIIDFIPAMIILFLFELFSDGLEEAKKKFSKLFIMGSALIPSGIYILWLHGEEHHVIVGLHVLLGHKGAIAMFFFGITFAILIFIVNKDRFKESKYLLTALIFLMSVIQWAFVTETGENAKHGNFDWGLLFGDYLITLVCFSIFLQNIYNRDTFLNGNKTKQRIYFALSGIVLLLSVLSQVTYFMIILSGRSYMK